MALKLTVTALSAVLVGGALGVAGGVLGPDQAAAELPAPMETVDPHRVATVRDVPVARSTPIGGTVIPAKEVTLAAQIPGRVVSIAGAEGDSVEPDQVVVRVDEDDLKAQRRAAVAQLRRADANLRNAHVQYQRQLRVGNRPQQGGGMMGMPMNMMQMFPGMGESRQDRYVNYRATVYDAGTGIAQARAAQAEARSRIAEIDAMLRDAQSQAPFPGVILEKLVEVGDPVQPGQPLVRLADVRNLQVLVEVPARLVPALDPGMAVPVRLDVHGVVVEARVARVYPMADARRHTVRVKLDLPQGVPATAGMYAEVAVPPSVDETVASHPVVPADAVGWRGNLPVVQVVDETGGTQLRLVRVGERSEDGYAVLTGLEAGERVLLPADAHGGEALLAGREI